MATNSDNADSNIETLSTMFEQGLELYNEICNCNEPMNSGMVQLKVKKAMGIFEQATRLVSLGGIFSTNEGIEEVATNDLRYFLLPALLGSLTLKLTSGVRKDIIDVAEVYFKDFLTRCNDYGLTNYNTESKTEERDPKTDIEKITQSVSTRASKIQRFKEQKELKSKLVDLKKNLDNEYADEEIKRDYFLTMLTLFIHEAIDELASISNEKPILEYMAHMNQDEKKPEPRRPVTPLKPIIITKDEVQKAIFGAGYPSLPTMTVQEFYNKRVQDGIFPDPNQKPSGGMSIQAASLAGVEMNNEDRYAEHEEKAIEEDDPENIERMRRMDEFKDEHRRGWGNRMNRS